MDFQQLKVKTSALDSQAFRPGTAANHVRQADSFIIFYANYGLQFLNPAPSILAYYINHPSIIFTLSKSVRNYVSQGLVSS